MITRRALLRTSAAAAFSTLNPDLLVAAAPGDKRFVVIILRGAIDGLDVIRPVGDPAFTKLRPDQTAGIALDPDGFFSLNPSLAALEPMFKANQMSILHAVATPYRNRSHFEGQDVLELGTNDNEDRSDGWLNRLLGVISTPGPKYAVDISPGSSLILEGRHKVSNWYPELHLNLKGDSLQFLQSLYRDDALLSAAIQGIGEMSAKAAEGDNTEPGVSGPEIARLAGRLLNEEARIAAFSLTGWDTHIQQDARMPKLLDNLAKTLLALETTLDRSWDNTVVALCSEFGRTAHMNGTGGTDHGTGGVAMLAGGLLANGMGGRVLTQWPGLADSSLLDGRDLMPTEDIRRYLGWTIAGLFGLSPSTIAGTIFSGVDMKDPLRLL